MKALIQTGSNGRVPVPPEKQFLIHLSVVLCVGTSLAAEAPKNKDSLVAFPVSRFLLTPPMWCINVTHMKTTTIRALRHDTTTVLSWVAQGESVEVQRRGKPVAILSQRVRKPSPKRPDFLARIRAVYGDQVIPISATELISEARGEM